MVVPMKVATVLLAALACTPLLGTTVSKADIPCDPDLTSAECQYVDAVAASEGITPQALGLPDQKHEAALGEGICLALNGHSLNDVDAGIKRHWPNLSQVQVNALIGLVGVFCENTLQGKLG